MAEYVSSRPVGPSTIATASPKASILARRKSGTDMSGTSIAYGDADMAMGVVWTGRVSVGGWAWWELGVEQTGGTWNPKTMGGLMFARTRACVDRRS